MAVQLSQFTFSVTLTKLVHRDGSEAGSNSTPIDLTPYCGTAGAVTIRKNIREPAGGWSVSFADLISATYQDTLYALIEPMDMIEIRASRSPVAGQPLPPLMRGFVSDTRRSESISSDGRPNRVVIVRGQDAGKLLQRFGINWQYAVATNEPYVARFAPLETNGIPTKPMKVSAFMQVLVENVVKSKVNDLNVFANAQVKPFTLAATVPDGSVIPSALGDVSGSLWQLMMRVADAPIWNELFVLDSERGPVVIFRPRPSRDVTQADGGSYIMPGASNPGTIIVSASEVVSLDVVRSDAGVANLFWVDPGVNLMNTNFGVTVGNLVSAPAATSPANAVALYGLLTLSTQTQLAADSDQVPYAAIPAPLTGPAAFVKQRIEELQTLNKNNVLFEEGAMVVRGSERFVPGQFLTLNRGATSSTSYLTAVEHTIQPLVTWTTALTFERSDGFYKRDQSATGWGWAEGRSGPYTASQSA